MPEGTDTTQTGATPTAPAATEQPKPAAPKADPVPKAGDQPLGEPGIKALEAEREARKGLEQQLAQMREGLASVFGVKPDGKATAEELVSTLSKQVGDLQHSALVDRLARQNGITDDDDIDLLRSAKDEDAMTRLATRLAAKAEPDETKPGTPKPDLTQGGKGAPALNSSALEESLKAKLGIS